MEKLVETIEEVYSRYSLELGHGVDKDGIMPVDRSWGLQDDPLWPKGSRPRIRDHFHSISPEYEIRGI